MKRYVVIPFIAIFVLISFFITHVQASSYHPQTSLASVTPAPTPDALIQGAILYDRWYSALGKEAPAGNMPIWGRQSTNSRSGADTWRCVECHGWDYKGVEGAYSSGSHYTGFPNISALVPQLSQQEIVDHLKGSKDPAHDFSKYMDDASLTALAYFLKNGLIDDAQYIDKVSLKVIGGDPAHGKQLYNQVCANCHGMDGMKIVFHSEGVDEYLGSVANRDPWRFLHRTRFGVAGVDMPVAAKLGWTAEDGRDVLDYAQTLPASLATPTHEPASVYATPPPVVGGPPTSTLLGGIFTGFGSILLICLGSVVFLGILVGIGVLVVSALRKK
jgi:Cytochrome C oxidase, cbb3-type, subunit III